MNRLEGSAEVVSRTHESVCGAGLWVPNSAAEGVADLESPKRARHHDIALNEMFSKSGLDERVIRRTGA
ncbi:hypothetical protein, partial [Enterococcus sp. HPCN18]|uniref:hypothetical protein n=1 Tax=Enterococcus sp. HPCN18 TaxID=2248751 RepID=UPI001C65F193